MLRVFPSQRGFLCCYSCELECLRFQDEVSPRQYSAAPCNSVRHHLRHSGQQITNLNHTPSPPMIPSPLLTLRSWLWSCKPWSDPPPVRSGFPLSQRSQRSRRAHNFPLHLPPCLTIFAGFRWSLMVPSPSQSSLAQSCRYFWVSFPIWAHPPFDGRFYVPAILLSSTWCHCLVLLSLNSHIFNSPPYFHFQTSKITTQRWS